MLVYDGVVRNQVVILPPEAQLADGVKVEVRIRPKRGRQIAEITAEEQFRHGLVAAGLLCEAKAPYEAGPIGDRTPVQVAGKPVSETIIEERR